MSRQPFPYGAARRSLYVELPAEGPSETLLDMQFKESVAHPGVFQHETRDILLCVHVDDLFVRSCTRRSDVKNELETLLMGEDDDMVRKLSISAEHWNGARPV